MLFAKKILLMALCSAIFADQNKQWMAIFQLMICFLATCQKISRMQSLIMSFSFIFAMARSPKNLIGSVLLISQGNSLPTKNFETRYMPEVGLPMQNAIFLNLVVRQIDWLETI